MDFVYIGLGVLGIVFLLIWLFHHKSDSGDVRDRITKIQNQQGSTDNKWAAQYHADTSGARGEHTRNLTREAEATYDLDTVIDRKDREEILAKALHDNALLNTQTATEDKISVTIRDSLKLASGVADIEVDKARKLKEIDWQFFEKEHREQLRGALLLAIREHAELQGVMDLYEASVRRKHQIDAGNDPPEVKRQLSARYDQNISILNRWMDGKGNRLLQKVDGQEPKGT